SVSAPSGGGGGRTGRSIVALTEEFTVSEETVQIKLRQGETKRTPLKITNIGTAVIDINVDLRGLENFLVFEGTIISPITKITLQPREEANLQLVLQATDETKPGSYLKKIKLRSATKEKEILIVIDVSAKEILFDVDLEIPAQYLEIAPGSSVVGEVTIFNIKKVGKVDVNVDFFIQELNGSLLTKSTRVVGVEIVGSFIERLSIPKELEEGAYLLIVKVTYDSETAVASELFQVKEPRYLLQQKKLNYLVVILFSLLILSFVVYSIRTKIKRKEEALVEEIHELILYAHEYAKYDRKEALLTYKTIKKKFNKLPDKLKQEVWRELRLLIKELRLK
ncbi:MAG: hypothetical protein AABX59_02020, partial [Nanoarchaeota archaeon]